MVVACHLGGRMGMECMWSSVVGLIFGTASREMKNQNPERPDKHENFSS